MKQCNGKGPYGWPGYRSRWTDYNYRDPFGITILRVLTQNPFTYCKYNGHYPLWENSESTHSRNGEPSPALMGME